MSKRVNNKKGNSVRNRVPSKYVPCKVRGGFHGIGADLDAYLKRQARMGSRYIQDMKLKEERQKKYAGYK